MLSGPGQTFFVGLFRDSITGQFDISIGEFGFIFSSATLVSAAVFLWSGKLIDTWPLRKVTISFCTLFAVFAALLGVAFHLIILVVAIFGIRHLGQALMSHISSTTMARYFNHNRAKAISLSSLGYSISEAIFPICVVTLIALIGWRFAWEVIAVFIGLVFLPVALWLLGKTNRDLSLEREVEEFADRDNVESGAVIVVSKTRGEVLKDWRFWLILPAGLSSPFLFTGVFFHQSSLASELGMSMEMVAFCFTTFAVAKMLGSLIIGPIADRYGYIIPYPICYALFAISIFALALSEDGNDALIFYGLSGFSIGMVIPVGGSMWPQLFGVRHLGAIKSMMATTAVIGTGFAPASFGYLIDMGVETTRIAWWGAIYTSLSVVLLIMFSIKEAQRKGALADLPRES